MQITITYSFIVAGSSFFTSFLQKLFKNAFVANKALIEFRLESASGQGKIEDLAFGGVLVEFSKIYGSSAERKCRLTILTFVEADENDRM